MKPLYGLVLLLLASQFSLAQGRSGQEGRSVHAFGFHANDSLDVEVNLGYSAEGNPVSYSAHLQTDVCSDGLCKPVSISIQWDLLGNFHSYSTDQGHRLTKFDHVELTAQDHRQLHRILSDTASILRDYEVEDMIDTTVHLQSFKLDAVTGATSKTFDGATVEGALYTVYTLWHFTNGPVRKRILEHTRSLLSDSFVRYMLHSGNRDYVAFIFKNLTGEQRGKFVPDILELISNRDTYIPHFALAQLSDSILANYSYQHEILRYLPTVNSSVKNVLLERFQTLKLDGLGLAMLMSFVSELQENQILNVFSIIENNKSQLHKGLIKQLEALLNSSNKIIAQQAKIILHRIN